MQCCQRGNPVAFEKLLPTSSEFRPIYEKIPVHRLDETASDKYLYDSVLHTSIVENRLVRLTKSSEKILFLQRFQVHLFKNPKEIVSFGTSNSNKAGSCCSLILFARLSPSTRGEKFSKIYCLSSPEDTFGYTFQPLTSNSRIEKKYKAKHQIARSFPLKGFFSNRRSVPLWQKLSCVTLKISNALTIAIWSSPCLV